MATGIESRPAVTVGIAAFNEGALLADAVASVRRQNFHRWECVLVNDASRDEETIRQCRLIERQGDGRFRVIWRTENGGLAAVRNTAVAAARAPLFVDLDGDDLLPNDALAMIVDAFLQHPEAGYVYGHYEAFGDWNYVHRSPRLVIERDFALGVPFSGHTPFRKEVWERVGGYPLALSYGMQDWGFWLKVAEAGIEGAFVDQVLYRYRARPGTMARRRGRKYPSIYEYLYREHRQFIQQHGPGRRFRGIGYTRGAQCVYVEGDSGTARRWALSALWFGDWTYANLRIVLMTTVLAPIRALLKRWRRGDAVGHG
jgi:glycosyltransferase involved in cell wall biosynthesis